MKELEDLTVNDAMHALDTLLQRNYNYFYSLIENETRKLTIGPARNHGGIMISTPLGKNLGLYKVSGRDLQTLLID